MIQTIYDKLVASLDLTWPTIGDVRLSGADPYAVGPVISTFRIGESVAAVLGAQAAAVCEIWRRRTGRTQTVSIDAMAGAMASYSVGFQSQHGSTIAQPEPSYPLVDLYPAKDGRWFMLHGAYPLLRNGLLSLLGCSMEPASIARAVAGWDAFALEEEIARFNVGSVETPKADGPIGLCGVAARSRDEWLTSPQGRALAGESLVEITRIGDAPSAPFRPAARPLSGLRVLDCTHVIAGPTVGKTLAEQGATVLRITSSSAPTLPPFDVDTGHGKLAAYLDLSKQSPADLDHWWRLAAEADVVVNSFRPGSLAKDFGISPESLAAARPGIVVLEVDCYGWAGPWASRPGWEQLAQVATGMAVTQGQATPDPNAPGKPVLQSVYPNDYLTGFLGALGVLTALIKRADEGGSWRVRVSLCRTAMWLQDQGLVSPAYPKPVQPQGHTITAPSAFGALTYLGPVLAYGETPSHWDRQTVPLGADPAHWPAAPRLAVPAEEAAAIRRHAVGMP